jgi:hypothetical protein
MAMTKKEFIEALHAVCPAFRRDFESYVKLIIVANSVSWRDENDWLTEQRRLAAEFENKWPHSWCEQHRGLQFAIPLSLKSPKSLQEFMKVLEILNQAKAANVELDPVRENMEVRRAFEENFINNSLPESLFEKEMGFKPSNEMTPKLVKDKENEIKKNLRQRHGEVLFRRAAIVIPVYAYTNKDDIDWEGIEQLKKLFYGKGYRPKPDQYEKIVKVFQAGQLLEEKAGKEETAYKSWQEVADSVGLELSTVRYIYDKAHQLVFGFPAKKRQYGVEEELVIPESPKDIPDDPGPKLKERLTTDGEIGQYKGLFEELEDIDREKCCRCQRLIPSSGGKYMPHDNRPEEEIFICLNCLSPSS